MRISRAEQPVPLIVTDSPEVVGDLKRGLWRVGIPFDLGLVQGSPPRVLFSVPPKHLERARRLLDAVLEGEDEDLERLAEHAPAEFPWAPVLAVLVLIAVHMGLVFLMASPLLERARVIAWGGVSPGAMVSEPWRWLTSIVLHSAGGRQRAHTGTQPKRPCAPETKRSCRKSAQIM